MSVNSEIIAALAPLSLPTVPNIYTGTASTYMTFNYNTLPDDFADNEPQHERYLIQVHLVSPVATNTLTLQSSIKTLLLSAGFDYPSTIDASDDTEQHIVFETETVVYIGG